MAGALRPLRPGLRQLPRPFASRRLLAALPLLQRGWFFHQSPRAFGNRFLAWAKDIRDNPPAELVCQELYPWLDQISLPLVIHSFGGTRPGPDLSPLDGSATCHYRTLPLLYARGSDQAVEVLESLAVDPELRPVLLRHWGAFRRMVIQGEGAKARALLTATTSPAANR